LPFGDQPFLSGEKIQRVSQTYNEWTYILRRFDCNSPRVRSLSPTCSGGLEILAMGSSRGGHSRRGIRRDVRVLRKTLSCGFVGLSSLSFAHLSTGLLLVLLLGDRIQSRHVVFVHVKRELPLKRIRSFHQRRSAWGGLSKDLHLSSSVSTDTLVPGSIIRTRCESLVLPITNRELRKGESLLLPFKKSPFVGRQLTVAFA
jgi:hypothetical protein